ncbi:putative baseplate assembly protein [Streptomyces triculaminicus]|uniref:putative baseplate assembly protein n=1 Tax=Streptomyces triculaminicus TaxID=2816232 RepID=UPI0033E4337E
MNGTDCGCEDTGPAPVGTPANPPGLDALAYRIGTHGAFKAAMLERLGGDAVLRRLATRDDGDPVVALIDACAAMLDVLTFYQERIANEGFLRTATERMSALELARAIGYELRPGVSAGTALAFTLTEPERVTPPPGVDVPAALLAVTTPPSVRIAVGTRAQSIPGQDELPRTFETDEEIEARPEWNALRVPTTQPVPLVLGSTTWYLDGTTTRLTTGDVVLLLADEADTPEKRGWDAGRVVTLRTVERDGSVPAHTVVTADSLRPTLPPARPAQAYALRTRAAVFGHNAVPWETLPVALRVGEWVPNSAPPPAPSAPPGDDEAAPPAPTWVTGPYADRRNSWADAPFPSGTTEILLDRTYPGIVPGSWVVLAAEGRAQAYTVEDVYEETAADFLLQAQVTKLVLTGPGIQQFSPRTTTVHAQPEPLPTAEHPLTTPLSGDSVTLAGQVAQLPSPGRLVAVRGRHADTGEEVAEVRRIAGTITGPLASLELTEALTHAYVPDSVRINANVAPATDGESRTEILGSGDGSVPFPTFTLLGRPLTHVPAATASGGRSTLRIRVDGVRWDEVATLRGQPPDARAFTTRIDDDGVVTVRFGDGRTGARLPTGRDNVVADYRVGTGRAGNLDAGRISLLLSRPLGLQDVINPVPATGAEDPERLDQARLSAPATVLTLDRIVSLRDHEDFARSFSGVGKAKASAQWDGERQFVRLVVDAAPPARARLAAAIDAARHADHQVRVDSYEPRPFSVKLQVGTAADRVPDDVLTAVTRALVEAFAFDRRDFGQPVAASEVLAAAQGVPGVRGAVLRALHFTEDPPGPADVLTAGPAHLLTLMEADVHLTDLTEHER